MQRSHSFFVASELRCEIRSLFGFGGGSCRLFGCEPCGGFACCRGFGDFLGVLSREFFKPSRERAAGV
jgi:hypothetical protein